jgi:hypothetical protein
MSQNVADNTASALIIPPRIACSSETVYQSPSTVVVSPPDVTTMEQMTIVQVSGPLRFWNAPEEDRYGPDDGKPV